MEIPLNISKGPRQREFLDYLNSALRDRMNMSSGSAGQDDNGSLYSETEGNFQIDAGQIGLKWRLEKDANGTLVRLVASATDSDAPANWETAAYEFATSVLAATLADNKRRFFQRNLYFYIGPNLDGEYWLPGFRFAPVIPDDPEPHLLNAERPISIDQSIDAIDKMHAAALATEAAQRIAARLSLLLNVGLYDTDHNMRWVWVRDDGTQEKYSRRCSMTFSHPNLSLQDMPEKGAVCPLGAYSGSLAARYRVAGELQSLPGEARKILRGVDSAEPAIVESFDCAARLYQVASVCGSSFPSVGLAYRVAAVEAMSAADSTCNGFSEFMRKYVSSTSGFDDILDYLYGYARSGHFHGGAFPMGEFSRAFYLDPLMDTDWVNRDALHRTCYELTREAIVNWMQSVVPEPETDLSDSE